jgi:hypothetical protein
MKSVDGFYLTVTLQSRVNFLKIYPRLITVYEKNMQFEIDR